MAAVHEAMAVAFANTFWVAAILLSLTLSRRTSSPQARGVAPARRRRRPTRSRRRSSCTDRRRRLDRMPVPHQRGRHPPCWGGAARAHDAITDVMAYGSGTPPGTNPAGSPASPSSYRRPGRSRASTSGAAPRAPARPTCWTRASSSTRSTPWSSRGAAPSGWPPPTASPPRCMARVGAGRSGPNPHERVPIVPAAILFDLGGGAAPGCTTPGPRGRRGGVPGRHRRRRSAQGSLGAGYRGAHRRAARRGGDGIRGPRIGSDEWARSSSSTPSAPPFAPDGRLLASSPRARESKMPTPDVVRVAAHHAALRRRGRAPAGRDRDDPRRRGHRRVPDRGRLPEARRGGARRVRAGAVPGPHGLRRRHRVRPRNRPPSPPATGLDEVDLQTAAANCVALAIVRAVLASGTPSTAPPTATQRCRRTATP